MSDCTGVKGTDYHCGCRTYYREKLEQLEGRRGRQLDALTRERDALQAKLDRVQQVLDDLDDDGTGESDLDWQEDPVACIRDTLRAALGEAGA